MQLTDRQCESLATANARLNFWDGPIRSGKTVGSNARWMKYLMQVDQHDYPGKGGLIMAGVSVGSVLRNVVDPIREMIGEECRYVPSRSMVKLLGHDVFIFGGAQEGTEKNIRGLTLGGALVDEMTLLNKVFFRQLLGRLSVKGAKLFGSTNPDGPKHWLKTEFIDKKSDHGLNHYTFPLSCNPHLDPEYVAAIKREFTGMWRARMIEGIWAAAEGLIYPGFEDRAPFVIDRPPAPASSYYITCDYGIQNPTVFVLMGRTRIQIAGASRVWAEREYYYSGRDTGRPKTDAELVDDLIEWAGPDVRSKLMGIIVDPSASSLIEAMRRRHLPVKAACNEVLPGIQRQARALFSGEYAICRACVHVIEEYFQYRWDLKAAMGGKDTPIKEHDHCLSGETLVDTTAGKVAIRDLVGKSGEIFTIKDGVPIISKFEKVRLTRRNQRLWQIKTDGGADLCATGDHKLYSQGQWVEIQNLKAGDIVSEISSYLQRDTIQERQQDGVLSFVPEYRRRKSQTPSICLYLRNRGDTGRVRNSPQGPKQRKQRAGKPYLYNWSKPQNYPFGTINAGKNTADQRDAKRRAVKSEGMARNGRGEGVAPGARLESSGEHGNDRQGLRDLRKTVQNKTQPIETLKILPPELQGNGPSYTAKVTSVTRLDRFEDVYCLTVPETGCFSVEGGLIVKNCKDAERYYFNTIEAAAMDYAGLTTD